MNRCSTGKLLIKIGHTLASGKRIQLGSLTSVDFRKRDTAVGVPYCHSASFPSLSVGRRSVLLCVGCCRVSEALLVQMQAPDFLSLMTCLLSCVC